MKNSQNAYLLVHTIIILYQMLRTGFIKENYFVVFLSFC